MDFSNDLWSSLAVALAIFSASACLRLGRKADSHELALLPRTHLTSETPVVSRTKGRASVCLLFFGCSILWRMTFTSATPFLITFYLAWSAYGLLSAEFQWKRLWGAMPHAGIVGLGVFCSFYWQNLLLFWTIAAPWYVDRYFKALVEADDELMHNYRLRQTSLAAKSNLIFYPPQVQPQVTPVVADDKWQKAS